jgi:hypothetical protein
VNTIKPKIQNSEYAEHQSWHKDSVSEELSGRRIVRVQKFSTKNCPGEELSSEELSERKIVRSKNCPGEELSE